jgi:hypothetical protein
MRACARRQEEWELTYSIKRDQVMINMCRGVMLALIMGLAAGLCVQAAQPKDEVIASRFDRDDEGWAVVGDVQEKKDHKPSFHLKGGNPGGYLSAKDDATGGNWYWRAPTKFLGDRSSSYGKTLSFELTQSKTNSQYEKADVILVGTSLKLVFKLPKHPGTDWTPFEVPLAAKKGWKKLNLKGEDATAKEMREVLGALQKLLIRGEYREGNDTGKLDNVVLKK